MSTTADRGFLIATPTLAAACSVDVDVTLLLDALSRTFRSCDVVYEAETVTPIALVANLPAAVTLLLDAVKATLTRYVAALAYRGLVRATPSAATAE